MTRPGECGTLYHVEDKYTNRDRVIIMPQETSDALDKAGRVSVKTRLRNILLAISITGIAVIGIMSTLAMSRIQSEAEAALMTQAGKNIHGIVKQKAAATNEKLANFKKHIEFLTDYIESLYANYDVMVAQGRLFDFPRATTPKGAYSLTAAFANKDLTFEQLDSDIRLFSNLQMAWEPIAKGNEGLITTVYAGTTSGLLTSYDIYAHEAAVSGDEKFLYDYTGAEWYRTGLKGGDVFFTSLYVDSQGRGLTITVGKGFKDKNGVVRGVDCADFDITGLYNEMIQTDAGEGTLSFAIDTRGQIISPDMGSMTPEQYTGLKASELLAMVENKDGIMERSDAFYVYTPIEKVGWTLCTRVPRAIILDNVQEVSRTIRISIYAAVLIAILLIIVILFVSGKLAETITHPIRLLEEDMEMIAGGDLEHKAVRYRNDEIGDMAGRLNEMVARLKATLTELKDSQEHAAEMSELATTDALTGVRNKTAYDAYLKKLDWEFANNKLEFGFAMVDLNYLKRINDTFGHERGNVAIRKICRIICETYVHSPVFRVGGDEFVVVLRGVDYENRESLADAFAKRVDAEYTNEALEPWERVSAAIGYAVYDEKIDMSAQNVFHRADNAMYENKKAMRATRE